MLPGGKMIVTIVGVGRLAEGIAVRVLAGDDAGAKSQVAELVRDGGLRPVDTGPLRRARELEAFQLLHMTIQGPLRLNWASAIKLLP